MKFNSISPMTVKSLGHAILIFAEERHIKNIIKQILLSAILSVSFLASSFAQNFIPGSGINDIDGNNYPTIIINGKEWMASNLNVSRYNNGDTIPITPVGLEWVHLTSGSWVYYNNDSANSNPYGKIYNYFSVDDTRGLCPVGWRVPSTNDFDTLINEIGGYYGNAMKLKVSGDTYWTTYITFFGDTFVNNGNNLSGFSGVPSGFRYGMSSQPFDSSNGQFNSLGSYLNLWTTTPALNSPGTDNSGNGFVWVVNISGSDDIVLYEDFKEAGNAVRCMREAVYNSNCSNDLILTPQNISLQVGETATFAATTSDLSPSYVWQSDLGQGFQTLNNFGNYSGVNTATLNIANVQLPNHSQPIRVISASGNCIDTSNVVVINIMDTCITNITLFDTITTHVFDTSYVTQTVYDTLLTTVTDTLIINALITGINPPNNQNTLKVFPNPTSTHITINYGNFSSMNGYTIKIVNAIGQTVYTTPINQQISYIDLSTWTGSGIYYVQLIDTQNNIIENRKIVIQ
jgi:uncharacterized protein (TIGR02145 family)